MFMSLQRNLTHNFNLVIVFPFCGAFLTKQNKNKNKHKNRTKQNNTKNYP